DGRPSPRAMGHVGELEGDVAAAHECDPLRQPIELEEIRAGGEVGFTLDPERPGPGAGRDQEVTGLQRLVSYDHSFRIPESRLALIGRDARLLERGQAGLRNRVGE